MGTTPPNGPVSDDGRLELWDVAALGTDAAASERMCAVVHCLGSTRAPLPEILGDDGSAAAVVGCSAASGVLSAPEGVLPGLYGTGIAFAADELSSGAPYPEASLKAFTARAHSIVADLFAGKQAAAEMADGGAMASSDDGAGDDEDEPGEGAGGAEMTKKAGTRKRNVKRPR